MSNPLPKFAGAASAIFSFLGNSAVDNNLERTVIAAAVASTTYFATHAAGKMAKSLLDFDKSVQPYEASRVIYNDRGRINPHGFSILGKGAAIIAFSAATAYGSYLYSNDYFSSFADKSDFAVPATPTVAAPGTPKPKDYQ